MYRQALFVVGMCMVIGLLFGTRLAEELLAFLLVGMIPFTSYALPSPVLFMIYALMLVFGARFVTQQLHIAASPRLQDETKRAKARQKVLKKTNHVHPTVKRTSSSQPRKKYRTATEQ